MLILCLILVIWAFLYIQHLYRSNQDVHTSFRLYALRDKLRMLAIDKKINEKHRLFKYLDTSISKSTEYIDFVNLRSILIFAFVNKRQKDYSEAHQKLMGDIENWENHLYKSIFDEFVMIIRDHLKTQHLLLTVIYKFLKRSDTKISTYHSHIDQPINNFPTYKESSTMLRYYATQ